MKHRRPQSVILAFCLSLMASALPAFSESLPSTKIFTEFTVLQLDKPVRFLNSDGLPSDIPAGTYQITAKSADTLHVTSTSTGKMQSLHATTITHTESLTIPYLLLIEDAGDQGQVHLVLLLSNGQGLDAEGRWQDIQTRGVGELHGLGFTPTQRYTGVVMQQGRVTMDDDFNEQEAISSSAMSKLHSNVAPSYGRVTMKEGRIKLDAEARQSLLQKCRFCARKQ
jgi:hypothetical protein